MGLSKVPSRVQLPGGRVLQGIPFKILTYHDDGSPATFEILPKGTELAKCECVLFADEDWIRGPVKK